MITDKDAEEQWNLCQGWGGPIINCQSALLHKYDTDLAIQGHSIGRRLHSAKRTKEVRTKAIKLLHVHKLSESTVTNPYWPKLPHSKGDQSKKTSNKT